MQLKQKLRQRQTKLVVGTLHTAAGWRLARRARPDGCDLLELRLDCLPAGLVDKPAAASLPQPLLVTARHPAEGGAGRLAAARRRERLEQWLPWAAAVDVELRSAGALAGLLETARRRGVIRVISFHDFRRTPAESVLRRIISRARAGGAEVVKIATTLRSAADLGVLLRVQASTRTPLATMGMGPLGKVSRLVLAAAGSCLNYGYLDRPQVPGQWPAAELAKRIREVAP